MKSLINKIKTVFEIFQIFNITTRYPNLKITLLVLMNMGEAVLDGFSLALIIPILQNLIQGVGFHVTLPISFLKFLEIWFNSLTGHMQIIFLGSIILVSTVFKSILIYIHTLWTESLSLNMLKFWRVKLLDNIMYTNIAKLFKYQYGYLQNLIIVECDNLRFVFRGLLVFVFSCAMSLVYFTILVFISAKLTLLTFGLSVLFIYPVYRLIKYIKATSYNRAVARSRLGAILAEIMNSLKIIHIFKTFASEQKRFTRYIDTVIHREIQMLKRSILIIPVNQIMAILAALLIISFGIVLSRANNTDMVWIILFLGIFTRFVPVLQSINKGLSAISRVYGSIPIIKDVIKQFKHYTFHNGTEKISSFKQDIRFIRVNFSYERETIMKNIDLTIKKGVYSAIVGPSGAGKSSIVSLIIRLFDPNKGEIRVDGHNLKDLDIHTWRGLIGFVDQTSILFNDTIANNIKYGIENISHNDIVRAARMAHAHEFIKKLEKGYNTNVGSQGNSLSVGQRQRIAIARALVRDPDIIILDEATSSIDSESELLIKRTIDKLRKKKKTIISIAHRLSTVKDADKFFFIDNGQLKGSGSFKHLMKINRTFRHYVRLQNIEN
ncbi:MAG: ABC transporter ATP-binding protein [Spirochaetes bacterium]|nr:ABC transporter ATP-binding protein [Spirochaetota bacterium]